MRVDFKDGQWAEIYSVGEMPRRVTVRLQDMLADAPESQSGFAALRDIGRLRDTLMAMLVKQWSYDIERTGSAKDMYDLSEDSYDTLVAETQDHWVKAGFTRESAKTNQAPASDDETPESSTSSA